MALWHNTIIAVLQSEQITVLFFHTISKAHARGTVCTHVNSQHQWLQSRIFFCDLLQLQSATITVHKIAVASRPRTYTQVLVTHLCSKMKVPVLLLGVVVLPNKLHCKKPVLALCTLLRIMK